MFGEDSNSAGFDKLLASISTYEAKIAAEIAKQETLRSRNKELKAELMTLERRLACSELSRHTSESAASRALADTRQCELSSTTFQAELLQKQSEIDSTRADVDSIMATVNKRQTVRADVIAKATGGQETTSPTPTRGMLAAIDTATRGRLQSWQASVTALRAELQTLQALTEQASAKQQATEHLLNNTTTEISALAGKLHVAKRKLEAMQDNLRKSDAVCSRLRSQIAKQESGLRALENSSVPSASRVTGAPTPIRNTGTAPTIYDI